MKKSFDIEFIKAHLERGEIPRLAKISGISNNYAYECLNEKNSAFNLGFLMACQKRAIERASALLAMKEQTQSLKTVLQ